MRWPALLANTTLLAEAEACDAFDQPATIARLRRHGDADQVRLAVDLVRARRKAAGKLDHAAALVADAEAVEQATGAAVARHKARRFAAGAGGEAVVDLCCGIGGDAMALAAVGPVTLMDRNPDRAWAARHNAAMASGRRCPTAAADVTKVGLAGRWFHLDPSRRADGRRFHRYEALTPGPAFIEPLIRACPGGALKLSPGVDLASLPAGEVEFISDGGRLRQAVLWVGRLAGPRRSATVLPAGETLSGEPGAPAVARAPGGYLLAVDPAVERAELVGRLAERLDAPAVHPKLGLLTRDTPVDHDPFVTCFERLDTLPFREKRLKQWLDAHDAGEVEVKTRGGAVDPDRLAPRLRGAGATRFTVFVLSHGRRKLAHVTRRIGGAGQRA